MVHFLFLSSFTIAISNYSPTRLVNGTVSGYRRIKLTTISKTGNTYWSTVVSHVPHINGTRGITVGKRYWYQHQLSKQKHHWPWKYREMFITQTAENPTVVRLMITDSAYPFLPILIHLSPLSNQISDNFLPWHCASHCLPTIKFIVKLISPSISVT